MVVVSAAVSGSRFVPAFVVAVEFFHFVKFAVFNQRDKFFEALRALDPKAGDIVRRIGSEQGGGLVMPRDPIAVFGVDELGIGMNGFSGRSDQHSFGNVGLVGLNLHDGFL